MIEIDGGAIFEPGNVGFGLTVGCAVERDGGALFHPQISRPRDEAGRRSDIR